MYGNVVFRKLSFLSYHPRLTYWNISFPYRAGGFPDVDKVSGSELKLCFSLEVY